MSVSAMIEEIANNSSSVTDFRGQEIHHEEQHLALAAAIATNTHLRSLNLAHSGMTNAPAMVLAESLKTNSTLTTLDLGYNKIQPEGIIALAEAILDNKTLTLVKIHRQHADYGTVAEQAIAKIWTKNTTLTRLYATMHDRQSNTANTRGEVRNKTIAGRIARGEDWIDLDPTRREEYAAMKEAERKAKAEAEEKANAPITEKVESTGGPYSYKQLTCDRELQPDDVDRKCRESYLTDEEFEELFKMNKEAFQKLPKWKRNGAKKKLKLH